MSLTAVGLLLDLLGVAVVGLVTDTSIAQDPEEGWWGFDTGWPENPVWRYTLRWAAWIAILAGFALQFVAEVGLT